MNELNPRDVRIDEYRAGKVSVRMTHQPTGQTVSGETEEGVFILRRDLWRALTKKVREANNASAV